MPVHDWTRVSAGTFHDFHNSWIVHLKESLNGGLLPDGYYAQGEQRAGQIVPDVLTLRLGEPSEERHPPPGAVAVAEAPPKVSLTMNGEGVRAYARRQRAVTIRHASDHRIVAIIEIASPGNKDREQSVRDFVDKAVAAMQHGYHLLLIDLLPPGPFDPDGLHGAVWLDFTGERYEPPAEKPLCLASYVAESLPRAYVEPIAVGTELPEMPLFLDPDFYVNVPLEPDYAAAYRGVPEYWRRVVEGGT
jgi:hypothetical protein